MRRYLVVSVAAYFGVLSSAGEALAAPLPLGCTFSGTVGTQATNWEFVLQGVVATGDGFATAISGTNLTTNAGAWGGLSAPASIFPLNISWKELWSPPSYLAIRYYSVTLGANLQGSGGVTMISTAAVDAGKVSSANVTITSGNCTVIAQ